MQATQAMGLGSPGVVPENLRAAVVDYLSTNISRTDNHATIGIVSTSQLCPVLSDNGHHHLALELISSISYSSYGYMFNNLYENATTLWQLFNAPSTGLSSSRNDIMYGSVGAWFYSHLAGILILHSM